MCFGGLGGVLCAAIVSLTGCNSPEDRACAFLIRRSPPALSTVAGMNEDAINCGRIEFSKHPRLATSALVGVICSRAIFSELCNTFNVVPRSSLMTGGAKRGVPNPWLFEESEETRGLGFDEIRQQQQKIIQGTEHPRSVGSETLSGVY